MQAYFDAAPFLKSDPKGGSLNSRIFAKKLKTPPKHIFALVHSTLKYKPYILQIIKASNLLSEERKLAKDINVTILLVHDLLFTKAHRIRSAKHPLKEAVLRHKNRLNAELVKLKLQNKVTDVAQLATAEKKAPVRWARLNPLKVSSLQKAFQTDPKLQQLTTATSWQEVAASPHHIYFDEFIPNLFAVHPSHSITQSPLYTSGALILQDRASCFPAHILSPKPEDFIIDACAAPGNKTTHLAAYVGLPTDSQPHIFAFEKDKSRANLLKSMVAKAGADKIISVINKDFTQSQQDSRFDEITGLLLDPSCSGSGIFGREVEDQDHQAGSEKQQERIAKLAQFQFTIVKYALTEFPSAERIVYSTCSQHGTENEAVVARLLADETVKENGWTLAPRADVVPTWPRRGESSEFEATGMSAEDAMRCADSCIRFVKEEDGGIGFFAAAFQREVWTGFE